MQQDRLRDRPGAEIQDAIDALGTPELRQLFTLWKQLEPLAMPPLP